jgi:sulfur-carrier protein
MTTVRVALPVHLQTLARVAGELELELPGEPTIETLLDALEDRYPMLRGTIREHGTRQRRAFMRYFAAGSDLSHEPPETQLPEPVRAGSEVFSVVGAISGG